MSAPCILMAKLVVVSTLNAAGMLYLHVDWVVPPVCCNVLVNASRRGVQTSHERSPRPSTCRLQRAHYLRGQVAAVVFSTLLLW